MLRDSANDQISRLAARMAELMTESRRLEAELRRLESRASDAPQQSALQQLWLEGMAARRRLEDGLQSLRATIARANSYIGR